MSDRRRFDDLPAAVRAAVAARVGSGFTSEDTVMGEAAVVAAVLVSERGLVFVKGVPDGHDGQAELDREARLAPHLPAFAPRLLWRITTGGWTLLGFEGLYTTPWAHFPHDSTHLDPCAALLRELSTVPAPTAVYLPPLWERWRHYDEPNARRLLSGEHLVHGDPAAGNFLIDADHRAHLVDWAWAASGPAWATAALWGYRLVLDGDQTPDQAAAWARTIPPSPPHPRKPWPSSPAWKNAPAGTGRPTRAASSTRSRRPAPGPTSGTHGKYSARMP